MITLLWFFLVSMVVPAIAVTLLTIADAFKVHHRFPLRRRRFPLKPILGSAP